MTNIFLGKNLPKSLRKPHRHGFSLIEVSAIIVIIGVLISGVIAADKMISKFRRATAKTVATSSPIHSIKDTALWLETSLDNGFNNSEDEDGAAISVWNDQQNSGNPKVSVVAVNGGPTYANTINRIHAVEFGKVVNGVARTGYLRFDASFLNNTDYTIMVLEKRKSASAGYFLGSASSNANDSLLLGYSSNTSVVHKQGSNGYAGGLNSNVSSYDSSTDKARLFMFVSSSTEGKKTYINGSLAAQDPTNTAQLSGVSTLNIGQGYTGEIGEIAIFTRALTKEERLAVEDYASKKWTRTNNRNSAPSCINSSGIGNYTVTDEGCDLSSAPCAISEVGFGATSVAATSSATTAACTADTANYGGSVTYTCISGQLTVTQHCTPAVGCSAQTVVGSNSQIAAIAHGITGSIICDATGYSGTTVNYTCNNGSLTPNPSCANNCDADHSGTTCSLCSRAGFDPAQGCTACLSNYDLIAGSPNSCAQKCTTPASTTGVTTGTLVPYSPTPQSCNISGYSGSYTYTCATAGGDATITSNTCAQTCTVTGMPGTLVTSVSPGTAQTISCNDTSNHFTGTATYTCSSGTFTPITACNCEPGYSLVSGVCRQNCAVSGIAGVTATTAAAGSGNLVCDANGYYGLIPYTCNYPTLNRSASCLSACTGGSIDKTSVPGSVIHKFTTVGTFSGTSGFTCSTARTVRVLVVGGGGGGSGGAVDATGNGGGGGGGMIENTSYSAGTTAITVTVGDGGNAGAANASGVNGQTSSFGTISVLGGGGGGGRSLAGLNGGSGGGGGIKASIMAAGTGTTGQGNNGGKGQYGGGGGGGAGNFGESRDGGDSRGGNGGIGGQSNIIGTNTYYAGGGAGGHWTSGTNQINGSGTETTGGGGSPGVAGASNTGGGGGAANAISTAGTKGGSGIVIVRY